MLISIMYHHVNSDYCSNDLGIFEEHLKYIKENFKTIFPGEKIEQKSVCLTFDDAYADFYFLIYPLLKKYNLKALLAIPTKYILKDTDEPELDRLSFKHDDLFDNYEKATFCTYKELKEMRDSGLIVFASHSHSHVNLLEKDVDLNIELKGSKTILEKELNIKIDSFVFPFGKYNQNILKESKKYYQYNFRIGNAIHKDFSGINGAIYRIDGDNLKTHDEIFRFFNILKYKLKGLVKRLDKQ
ncbi:polysaccharide deacetylase family protein [Arcobacter porcinus]|uniref:polysaccharide deacetylase family protein n=1 Tax=Arcobacter porcinus TaxID=1935204 RepID=UPI001CDAA984|nr:polysaccharide deacetylase family protein [Arcobacter porcinus]